MHHSDFIVVEKRLAKTQKELAARDRRIAELEAENERLLGILQFSRWTHDTHRPSYALNCLYEGEITIAKFCEWMKAFVAGVDEPLPDVKYRSCGFEFTPKELEAENERLRAELGTVDDVLGVNWVAPPDDALEAKELQEWLCADWRRFAKITKTWRGDCDFIVHLRAAKEKESI